MITEGNIGMKFDKVRPAMPESVIKWRMDTSDVLKETMAQFEGLGNEDFIRHMMRTFSVVINKVSIQGNMGEESVRELVYMFADTETEHIGQHYEKYELKPEDRDSYIDCLASALWTALSRTQGDWERKHTVDQGKETVTTTQGIQNYMPSSVQPLQQQQRKSFSL